MFRFLDDDGVAIASPEALKSAPETTRGPAPRYNPPRHPNDVPVDDPRWSRLEALREEAWRKGIGLMDLETMEIGACPDQVRTQTMDLVSWNASH